MEAGSNDGDYLRYENELFRFLRARIRKMGGSAELQHISGHLSQLRPQVRNVVGTSKVAIINFINKHSDTFCLENNVVSLINFKATKMTDYDSDGSSADIEATLPSLIPNGKGVVVKLLPGYGFIKSQQPVKSSVFFRAEALGVANGVDLTDCGINIGTMVNFKAVRERENFTAKYKAKKVWISDKNSEELIKIPNPRKNRDTGIYDPINLDGEGLIQNVFSTHGFILANGDKKNTVFFHKNRVVNYDNIVDLTKVFENGDLVEFSAHRTTKENSKARWEATKVWKKSKNNPSFAKHKKVPSKSSSSVISSITSKSSSSVISSSQSLTLPGFHSKSVPKQNDVKQKDSAREMIYDQAGKICPRSNGVVIKFGDNFKDLADGDSSAFYISGTEVKEISWEFSEGDDVKFDAVKIKSFPGWKALLVWVGDKPDVVLSPHLGDFSEFTDEELDEMEDEEAGENANEEVDGIVEEEAGETVVEIPDDAESSASGHLSLSSHSSLKSSSMFSDTSDFKRNKSSKGSSGIADSSANTENRKASNKGFKVRNLCNSPLHSTSESSYSSSKESTSSHQSKESKTSYQSKESKTSHQSKELSIGESCKNSHDFVAEKPVASFRDILESVNDGKTVSASKSHDITDIPDTKSKMVSKKSNSVILKNIHSDENELSVWHQNSEIEDNLKNVEAIPESNKNEIEKSTSITKHENIVGKISKVYSSFAEAKSPDFQNPVAFSWNIFYSNANSMDSLDLNDLREVLKVGETVHFNNFEIIDDNGQSWQKVSLAWSGPKPVGVHEMSPEEFIQQNNLSVTIKNVQSTPNPVKKFLVAYDVTPNTKDELDVSQTESCSEDDDKTFHSPVSFIGLEILEEPSSKFKLLSSMISQKLMLNRDILMDSKVDLNYLAAEIVNMVLEQYCGKEPSQSLLQNPYTETSDMSCSCKKIETISCQNVNRKNTEVQTICTGDIMAQNIFTD